MFSLIIAIVAVAIVVVLIAATMYHGGDSILSGSQHAASARLLNEGQQLHAALVTYQATTGDMAGTIDDLLTSNTLRSAPTGWSVINGYAYRSVDTRDVCLAANKKVGVDLVPTCSDPAYAGVAVCCSQGS